MSQWDIHSQRKPLLEYRIHYSPYPAALLYQVELFQLCQAPLHPHCMISIPLP